ncbi:MAG: hypothetical protein RL757_1587 [Bacteroidota bacterium]|jgi:hypothetical protein
MKKTNFLLLLGLLILGGGCCKEELPGGYAYKFSCKINGVPWEAKYKEHEGSFSRNDLDVSVFKLNDTAVMQIIATNATNGESLDLFFPFNDTTKITKNYSVLSILMSQTRCGGNYDMKRNEQVNLIKLTHIDKVSHIVRGSFEFNICARTTQCADTLRITEGIFDLKYQQD